jgi:hypothetical protein
MCEDVFATTPADRMASERVEPLRLRIAFDFAAK